MAPKKKSTINKTDEKAKLKVGKTNEKSDSTKEDITNVIWADLPAVVTPVLPEWVTEEMMQKVKETADLILSDSDSPEWLKTKVKIKGMGYNPQKTKLLRQRLSDVAKSSNDNGKEAQNILLNLQKESEKIFPVLDKATSPKKFLYKLSKYLPFVGGKVGDYIIKLQTIEKTMENMVASLEGAEKELGNTNSELDALKEANLQDIEELKKQVIFGKLLVTEIKDRMLALPSPTENMWEIDKKVIIEKDVLLPIVTRISDLEQKAIVSYQGIMNMTNIKEGNDALINGLRRAQEVTLFALQQTLIQFVAADRQGQIFNWLENLNNGTSELIVRLSKNIKEQSIAIADKTTSQTLDIATIKQAWSDAKETLAAVERIYKEALPKVEQNIKQLEQMNKEADESIKKLQAKEDTKNNGLNIIDDLGK